MTYGHRSFVRVDLDPPKVGRRSIVAQLRRGRGRPPLTQELNELGMRCVIVLVFVLFGVGFFMSDRMTLLFHASCRCRCWCKFPIHVALDYDERVDSETKTVMPQPLAGQPLECPGRP